MTAPLTPERLAEVRARERLAIGGTWEARVAEDQEGILYPTVKIDGEHVVIPIPDTTGDHTAIFIAHARTDVPDLLAALDAATERAERAEAALARVRHVLHEWTDGEDEPFDATLAEAIEENGAWRFARDLREAMGGKP